MSLPHLLVKFSNVTIAPVMYRGKGMFELRLYLPNRLPVDQVMEVTNLAMMVFARTESPIVGGRIVTLEANRASLCFNGFVVPTRELVEDVNTVRVAWKQKPYEYEPQETIPAKIPGV